MRSHQGVFGAVFLHQAARVEEVAIRSSQMELLEFVGIARFANRTLSLRAITGTLPGCKVDGMPSYLGQSLKGTKSFHLVEKKLAMVPEGYTLFTRMLIRENLMMVE